jgi:antitoxin ParD1/3/4
MATTIGFRPTVRDAQILERSRLEGETTSDTIRRALRLLDHEVWLEQARKDALLLAGEDLNAEPEAW